MSLNEQQWSSATPGLLIILLDESGSMLNDYQGNGSKTEFATKAVNRVIDEIIQKNFDGEKPKNRCFIAVLGYNHNVKELASGWLSDLDETPKRIEEVKKKVSDGAGGLVDVTYKMPIWVEPINSDGATNMKGAFDKARDIIKEWIETKKDHPAPVIINISDGVPYFDGNSIDYCMKQTIESVNEIKAIDTNDGKIQIFNAMIGDGTKSIFPTSASGLVPEASFLYEISTEIPESYKSAAIKNDLKFEKGARGAIYNADAELLIKMIDFGSSKGQQDKK